VITGFAETTKRESIFALYDTENVITLGGRQAQFFLARLLADFTQKN
jgi:hypothetical protein